MFRPGGTADLAAEGPSWDWPHGSLPPARGVRQQITRARGAHHHGEEMPRPGGPPRAQGRAEPPDLFPQQYPLVYENAEWRQHKAGTDGSITATYATAAHPSRPIRSPCWAGSSRHDPACPPHDVQVLALEATARLWRSWRLSSRSSGRVISLPAALPPSRF